MVVSASLSQLKAAPKFSEIFKYPRSVAITWTLNFLQAVPDYGFTLWGPTLLVLSLKITPIHAAKLFISVTLCSVIGKPLWAFISEAIGRRRAGMAMAIGAVITQLIFANFWQSTVAGLPVIWLSGMALYFFVNGGFAITGPYSAEIWPQRLRATGMGSAYGMGGIGRMFGPMILSLFAGAGTLVTPKATTAAIRPVWNLFALCAAVLFVTYYLALETKNKSIDEIEKMVGSPDASKETIEATAQVGCFSAGLRRGKPCLVTRTTGVDVLPLYSRPCDARNASPLATEVNSFPRRMRSLPNRVSKMRRTAGTNDVPPVRNTRSTARTSTPVESSSPSTHCSIFSSSSAIQCSNSARVTGIRRAKPPPLKLKLGALLLR